MRFLLIFALLGIPAAAFAQSATPPNWTPFQAFIGTWEGVRASPQGPPVKVERTYQTGEGSRELDVAERIGKASSLWGTVRFDESRAAFVLERVEAAGDPNEMVLDQVSGDGAELIFLHSS